MRFLSSAPPPVTVGHTVISAGTILAILAGIVIYMGSRNGRGGAALAVFAIIIGILLASAWPVVSANINSVFYSVF